MGRRLDEEDDEWPVVVPRLSGGSNGAEAAVGAEFGVALAGSGRYLAVGAAGANAVHIYWFDGETWVFEQKLTASGVDSTASDTDRFGLSCALDGATLAVGSLNGDDVGSNAGAVYVFVQNGTWSFHQKFRASETVGGDEFGASLSLAGTSLAIGAPGRVGGGKAYLFEQSATTEEWLLESDLDGGTSSFADSRLGASCVVSTDLEMVACGAPRANGTDEDPNSTGAAYMYEETTEDGVWGISETLPYDSDDLGNHFGVSCAILTTNNVDYAIVGDSGESLLQVFYRQQAAWLGGDLVTSSSYERVGQSLHAHGNYFVVGGGGIAYVLEPVLGDVSIIQTLGPYDVATLFGQSVALTDYFVAVGAPNASGVDSDGNILVNRSGAVYTWRVSPQPPSPQPTRQPTSPKPTDWPTAVPSVSPTEWPTAALSLSPTAFEPVVEPPTSAGSDGGGGGGGSSSSSNVGYIAIGAVGGFLLILVAVICCLRYAGRKFPFSDKEDKASLPEHWPKAPRNKPAPANESPDEEEDDESDDEVRALTQSAAAAVAAAAASSKGGGGGDVTRQAEVDKLLDTGRAICFGLLAAGSAVPLLGGACQLAQAILYEVDRLHEKADDVVSAGARLVSLLEVLQILAANEEHITTDDARRVVEKNMAELMDMLGKFLEAVRAFGQKGWLRQKWLLLSDRKSAQLTSLDFRIVSCLESLRTAYHLSHDRRIARLLEKQSYHMEEAMARHVDRLVASGTEQADAASQLAADERVARQVAAAGHVSDKEIRLAVSEVKDDSEALVFVHDKTQSDRDKARKRKEEMLATYEVDLDWIEPHPFARGGMTQIHMGHYVGQDVAVKVMPTAGLGGSQYTKLIHDLSRELAIMMKLQSPLVIRVFGVVTSDPNFLGLVLEYAEGGSLRHHLDDETMVVRPEQQRAWCYDIARGMTYLYSHGVEHRDLKAANVLLTAPPALRCKVTDFGLSRSEHIRTQTTFTKTGGGTAPFMAPELIDDNVFTEKSDVYSYAIVVWEILSRETPWGEMSHVQIAMSVVYKKMRPPLPKGVTGAEDLVKLMHLCWSHNPDDRPSFKTIAQSLKPAELAHENKTGDSEGSYFNLSLISGIAPKTAGSSAGLSRPSSNQSSSRGAGHSK
ncbi:hypothetical protein CTAYLR_007645 [Chrysophaeum taylorii]|uniref:Protein kinase domain-containing protein n=1 Tax=Chrysophaeum taylorii TaxID=2483200 RepID=A0AAD7U733_9STRA|nr:hypothetical protein CTAYLR_007645 [Chrysophaeum taylorii]